MSLGRHVLVTRFAVPRPGPGTADPGTAEVYRSREWLAERLQLFRRYFVPSVSRLGVPAVLLCGSEVAGFVAAQVADLEWARVEVQDRWTGGWRGAPDQVLTRLDSDDAVRYDWFEAVDRAPAAARICVTREFLRWDPRASRLHRYRRRECSPLAAFRGGENPYAVDHKHLGQLPGVHPIRGAYLLQVVHGGNLSNRPPAPWRLHRRRSKDRLAAFGVVA
jgi:hypothetical protein